jgi:hypothetical protein
VRFNSSLGEQGSTGYLAVTDPELGTCCHPLWKKAKHTSKAKKHPKNPVPFIHISISIQACEHTHCSACYCPCSRFHATGSSESTSTPPPLGTLPRAPCLAACSLWEKQDGCARRQQRPTRLQALQLAAPIHPVQHDVACGLQHGRSLAGTTRRRWRCTATGAQEVSSGSSSRQAKRAPRETRQQEEAS